MDAAKFQARVVELLTSQSYDTNEELAELLMQSLKLTSNATAELARFRDITLVNESNIEVVTKQLGHAYWFLAVLSHVLSIPVNDIMSEATAQFPINRASNLEL